MTDSTIPRRLSLEEKELIISALATATLTWQVTDKPQALRAVILKKAIHLGKINLED